MNLTRTIVLVSLLTLTVQAGWNRLEKVEKYAGTDYTLKANVAYMEIRFYQTEKSERANKIWTLYRKPLSSYPKNVISKFKNLKHRHTNKESYLRLRDHGNAFFIDTQGKMFWTDEIKDVKMLLGEIDTPAEVALILWLGYHRQWSSCKKTSHGYTIKSIMGVSSCGYIKTLGRVDRKGNYNSSNHVTHIVRNKCKKRKSTQFINHKKINYESYGSIAVDESENLYVVGDVKRNKTLGSSDYRVLDKYSSNGKQLWSKKTMGYSAVKVVNHFVYLVEDNKIKAKYSTNGKKQSFKRGEIIAKTVRKESKKYTPKLLPKEKKNIEMSTYDHKVSKKGNVYAVGMEEFYPYGAPSASGVCGNSEQINGAFIAKFDHRGKMLWAKVIDRDD